MTSTSTFIFRIARVTGAKDKKVDSIDTSGRTAQQLVLGEYYNHKVDKRKGGARLHWGQHHFMKGMFYIYQFADGSYTSSFNKDKQLESHVDVSLNFEAHHIESLLQQLKAIEGVLCRPPMNEDTVSELQDQYQLHIKVKADAVAEVSEFMASKSGQKDRLTIRINPSDVVEFVVVSAGDDAFKSSVGGTRIKLDTVMEGLFGKSGSTDSIVTVADVKERYITSSKSKKRKSRKKKSAANDVVAESVKTVEPKKEVIAVEDEDDDDIPL